MVQTLEDILNSNPYGKQVRNLSVVKNDDILLVSGSCASFYVKQMINQSLIENLKKLGLTSSIVVKNEILVDG